MYSHNSLQHSSNPFEACRDLQHAAQRLWRVLTPAAIVAEGVMSVGQATDMMWARSVLGQCAVTLFAA